jgi:hypothetical protein
MRRNAAALFVLLGLAVGIAGWHPMPSAPGRLDYAIEIADPRPAAEATMPQCLQAFHATHALAVDLQEGRGPSRFLLVDTGAKMLSSSDVELGKLPEKRTERTTSGPLDAMAGADTGLHLGPERVDGVELRIVAVLAVLQHLGPIMDSSIVMSDAPDALSALGPLTEKARARYLLLTETPLERSRALGRLRADASLLPTRAEVISLVKPLPMPNPIRITLAAVFIFGGALVIGIQVRRLGRDEIAQRFSWG